MKPRTTVLLGMIATAAIARVIPHPPNVTPVAAMALFAGACLERRIWAMLVPLAAMLLSDLVLAITTYGFGRLLFSQPVVYGCLAATVLIGRLVARDRTPGRIVAAVLAEAVLFFIVTNFAVWSSGLMYPRTLSGLAACYEAAIPYFRNSLLGDFAWSFGLFGGLALLERRVAWMRLPLPAATTA